MPLALKKTQHSIWIQSNQDAGKRSKIWFEGFQISPDHSLTNKKGNLLATSTSKIDIKTLRYFHQNKCSFTKWQPEFGGGYGQLACCVGAVAMMDNIGISKYHKQVISSIPPLTMFQQNQLVQRKFVLQQYQAKNLCAGEHTFSPRPWIISQLPGTAHGLDPF